MPNRTAIATKLKRFMRARALVRFTRPFEPGFRRGYVLDLGPSFFLLALLSQEYPRFNGFCCCRIGDVKELRRDPYEAFAEAALKKSRAKRLARPRVSVSTLEELLLAANEAFPLITIHREKTSPDTCRIGKVLHIEKGYLWLLEIGPNAKWDRRPSWLGLKDITCVEFGGGYEASLDLVGGRPPQHR